MKKIALIVLLLLAAIAYAQEEEKKPESKPVKNTFRDFRAYHNHTMSTIKGGELNFHMAHRFGLLSSGYGTLFGLDEFANIQIAFDYGLTDDLMIGISRIRYRRIHDIDLKYRLLKQNTTTMPLSATLMGYYAYDGFNFTTPADEVVGFSERSSYMFQVMLAKKFMDIFSLQISPQFIHRNMVPDGNTSNEAIALNTIARVDTWGVTAIQLEYHREFSDYLPNPDILALGMHFETARHSFVILFSNATLLSQTAVWSQTEVDALRLENMHFGFNIMRKFRL
jgi:hypothetical protein